MLWRSWPFPYIVLASASGFVLDTFSGQRNSLQELTRPVWSGNQTKIAKLVFAGQLSFLRLSTPTFHVFSDTSSIFIFTTSLSPQSLCDDLPFVMRNLRTSSVIPTKGLNH